LTVPIEDDDRAARLGVELATALLAQ